MNQDVPDPFGLLGRTLADKYLVERVVAKGGFGTVYYARHSELQTPVAVKVLMVPDRFQGDLRVEFLEKFKLEARTIAALNHASIVRVLDYGSARFANGESPWMALEWLEGRTLELDIATREGKVGRSPRETLDLLRPAFDALACAHETGIAHRDIKPANMMLVKARRGEQGLRMLDFGIAKVMEPEEQAGSGQTATQTELSAFSLLYAAPEQLSRARTGPWTDVHALALVITEVLTGTRAYRADDATQMYAEIVGRERPTPGRYGMNVGPWEEVLRRALSLRPSERYGNASDFLTALEGGVDGAEAAWATTRDRPLQPSTLASPDSALNLARGATPDTLMGATASTSPRSRGARLLPLGAVVALSVLAIGIYAVTRSPGGAVPARAAAASIRVDPAGRSAAPESTQLPSVPAVVTPPPMLPSPAAALVAPSETPPADDAPPAHGGRHGHHRRGAAAPSSGHSPAAHAAAPSGHNPAIVIE